jgi:hypothetical protein
MKKSSNPTFTTLSHIQADAIEHDEAQGEDADKADEELEKIAVKRVYHRFIILD